MKKIPNPIDKHVGSRVRMRRMMLSMSQGALAKGLKLTFQQVQKYEKGTNRIGASRLQAIAGILQVPVAFFFEGQPGNGDMAAMKAEHGLTVAPSIIADFTATRDGLSLIKNFSKIENSKIRRGIVDLVEQIAGEA